MYTDTGYLSFTLLHTTHTHAPACPPARTQTDICVCREIELGVGGTITPGIWLHLEADPWWLHCKRTGWNQWCYYFFRGDLALQPLRSSLLLLSSYLIDAIHSIQKNKGYQNFLSQYYILNQNPLLFPSNIFVPNVGNIYMVTRYWIYTKLKSSTIATNHKHSKICSQMVVYQLIRIWDSKIEHH